MIVGALMLGVIGLTVFATFTVLTRPVPVPPAGGGPAPAPGMAAPDLIWLVLAGVAMVMVVAGLKTVIRPMGSGATPTPAGGDPLAAAYTTSIIQRAAFVEAAGLLGGMILLMGNTLVGLVPAAAAVVALAWMFPSAAKYAEFAARYAAQPGQGV
ncbi:MAG: hypothetical protein LW650_11340 [Planctomycetaceae bacterium]|nr:hypothetical protein [Planctomycetaceae bacterium]